MNTIQWYYVRNQRDRCIRVIKYQSEVLTRYVLLITYASTFLINSIFFQYLSHASTFSFLNWGVLANVFDRRTPSWQSKCRNPNASAPSWNFSAKWRKTKSILNAEILFEPEAAFSFATWSSLSSHSEKETNWTDKSSANKAARFENGTGFGWTRWTIAVDFSDPAVR